MQRLASASATVVSRGPRPAARHAADATTITTSHVDVVARREEAVVVLSHGACERRRAWEQRELRVCDVAGRSARRIAVVSGAQFMNSALPGGGCRDPDPSSSTRRHAHRVVLVPLRGDARCEEDGRKPAARHGAAPVVVPRRDERLATADRGGGTDARHDWAADERAQVLKRARARSRRAGPSRCSMTPGQRRDEVS